MMDILTFERSLTQLQDFLSMFCFCITVFLRNILNTLGIFSFLGEMTDSEHPFDSFW